MPNQQQFHINRFDILIKFLSRSIVGVVKKQLKLIWNIQERIQYDQLDCQMNCHKLMYKPYRKAPHYVEFLKRQKEKQDKQKKELFYEEIIKFRESRYPLDFLKQLEQRINPFQLSLEKLKEVFSQRYPQYSNEMVNDSVQHIFNRKCQQSQMIKESAIVIEDGDEYIRNGRKLIKEDFTYDFSRYLGNDQNSKLNGGSTSRSKFNKNPQGKKQFNQSFQKNNFDNNGKPEPGNSTDRNALTSDRLMSNRSRVDSPSKVLELMRRTQRFNELLLNELKKDKKRFQNLQQIQQGAPQDTIYYNENHQPPIHHNLFTDRSMQNQTLNTFRESDLLVRPDVLDTGRSQVQELNFLLSTLNFEQGGHETERSKRSQKTLRINREIKEQLYNARGGLKLDLVRKAIQQLKRQNVMGTNTSRITKN